MTLPAPNLDSRRFEDLVREARARIPRYTPEWTNLNESDPGMTLVQLHAWMTETILYELNRVPELNYIKFLDLIGVTPRPAHPALTELTFELDKLDSPADPLTVSIPRLTKAAVDDPDLPQEVIFETDQTLTAVNAAIGALIVPKPGLGLQTRQLVTLYEEDATVWPHAFDPLGPDQSGAFYLGLLLRPIRSGDPDDYAEDKFPIGPLDLYADAVRVFDDAPPAEGESEGDPVLGPIGTLCPAPGSAGIPVEHVDWAVFTGEGGEPALFEDDLANAEAGWTRLNSSQDDTLGFSRSGHMVLEIPNTARPLNPVQLSADFWSSFGGLRPPQDKDELIAQLEESTPDVLEALGGLWEVMGATPPQVDELAACGESIAETVDKLGDAAYEIDPTQVTLSEWKDVNPDYATSLPEGDESYRALYWIRGRITSLPEEADEPVAMRGLHLNTASATQASTRLDDRLGRSNGRPAQIFDLPKTPVLIDPLSGKPDLELEISEEGQEPEWQRVDDFFNSGPDDPHYLLDPETGKITLGDGRRGRIPVADTQVTAIRSRIGGGAVGNVGTGLISKIKGRLRGVKGVTNLRPAHDGSDAEPIDDVKLRAPHDLRMRDRAVSAQDFADLALQTPGVAVHKAFALPRRAVAPNETLVEKDGSVTLLVLPVSERLTPQPDEDQKRAICRWLEPRRLITTELHIIGPRYAMITRLAARLTVRQEFDLGLVQAEVYDALIAFLDPFTGGEDGTGWPFGENIYYGDLYDRILGIDGVRRASRLEVFVDGTAGDTVADIAAVPEGHLPALPRDAIDLVVAYD
ncbi:MAG: putative baseplate assembly protein [Pseudomonadota bacterium]